MAQNVIINGVVYSDVPEVNIPKQGGGTAKFYDTVGADAVVANVLDGKKFYGANGEAEGAMTENGAVSGSISTKSGTYTIPEGHHNGSGTVGISSTEQEKIISGNIKKGVTILGVAGSNNVVDTTMASGAITAATVLSGYKGFVNGSQITGSASVPTVSQDSTSKILTIA